MKRKSILYFAIFFLVLSGITFFYERYRIPSLLHESQDIKKEGVYYTLNEIPKNTLITEDVINKNVDVDNIPVEYVHHKPIQPSELVGKKALVDIPAGAYLSKEFFISEDEGFKDGEQLYSLPISTSNAVVGKVEPNDYVTIWVRYNRDGGGTHDSEVVVPYIKIEDLTDESGNSSLTGASIHYAVIKANREIIQDIEIARKYELFLTKYGENEDFVPAETFDREEHVIIMKEYDNYQKKEDYIEDKESYLETLRIEPAENNLVDEEGAESEVLEDENIENESEDSSTSDEDTSNIEEDNDGE